MKLLEAEKYKEKAALWEKPGVYDDRQHIMTETTWFFNAAIGVFFFIAWIVFIELRYFLLFSFVYFVTFLFIDVLHLKSIFAFLSFILIVFLFIQAIMRQWLNIIPFCMPLNDMKYHLKCIFHLLSNLRREIKANNLH